GKIDPSQVETFCQGVIAATVGIGTEDSGARIKRCIAARIGEIDTKAGCDQPDARIGRHHPMSIYNRTVYFGIGIGCRTYAAQDCCRTSGIEAKIKFAAAYREQIGSAISSVGRSTKTKYCSLTAGNARGTATVTASSGSNCQN